MANELLCSQCGNLEPSGDDDERVYCSRCNAMLRYGEVPADDDAHAEEQIDPRDHPDAMRAPIAARGEVFEADEPRKKRRKRRRRKKAKRAVKPAASQNAWLDPVCLMWLVFLAPLLAFCTITFGIGWAIMPIVTPGGITGLGFPFMMGALFLGGVPLAYLSRQMIGILVEWSEGKRFDPPWEAHEIGEVLRGVGTWAGAMLWTAVVVAPVFVWGFWEPQVGRALSHPASLIGVALLVGPYLWLALLAMTLFHTPMAGNPRVVLGAMVAAPGDTSRFAIEWALHLSAIVGGCFLIREAWSVTALLAIPALPVWWALVILSISRLMRRLGMLFAQNQRRLGWFRQ